MTDDVPLDWYCDRGPCAAPRGHDGTCAEASGWNDAPLKVGEFTCRQTHADEWGSGRVNPCALCYLHEALHRYHNREKQ